MTKGRGLAVRVSSHPSRPCWELAFVRSLFRELTFVHSPLRHAALPGSLLSSQLWLAAWNAHLLRIRDRADVSSTSDCASTHVPCAQNLKFRIGERPRCLSAHSRFRSDPQCLSRPEVSSSGILYC